jgi:hypothetical protein
MTLRLARLARAALLALAFAAPTVRAADPPAASGNAPGVPEGGKEESWPLPAGAALELPAASAVYRAKKVPPRQADPRERYLRRGGDVSAFDALDEIIDEVAADVAHLGASRISPILVERIQLGGNLDPSLAGILEARLAAAVSRATDAVLLRCIECQTTHARVVDASWVVSHGVTRQEQARELARAYGARSFLRASLSASFARPAEIALDLEIVRAEDGVIAYAESYRFGGDHALLWRGADRAQAREERLKELEDILNRRPVWNFAFLAGYMVIPADGMDAVRAPYGALRVDERFGADRRHRVFFQGGGISHEHASGGIAQAGLATRVSPANAWSQTFELGASAGAFLGGSLGTSPLFAAHLDWRFGVRMGLGAMVGYLRSFKLGSTPVAPPDLPPGEPIPDTRPDVGGLFLQAGVSFTW